MKKKIVVFALCMAMVLSMAACGGKSEPAPAPAPAETQAAAAETEAPAEGEEAEAPAEAPVVEAGEVMTPDQLLALATEGLETSIDCEPIELTMACSGTLDGTVGGDAINAAIQAVSDWTGGNFKVNFYQGGQLGGDTELIEGVQMGTVDLMQGAPTAQMALMPNLAVLDIAGLFTDVQSCQSVIDSFYDQFQTVYNEKGLRLQAMIAMDFRILSSNKPVQTAEDLKGLNIRTQENPYHMTFWSQLGTNPTPLAFGELYIALQQGMMDAQENPPTSIVGAKLCEVQKYIVETNHIPFINTFVTNQAKYEAMSDAQKKAMDQFVTMITRYIQAGTAQDDARLLDICRNEYGIEVTPVSDAVKALYPAATMAVIEQMKASGNVDPAFVDAYVAASGFVAP